MGNSLKDQTKKWPKMNKNQGYMDDREDKSDRNPPKILSGSIKLPQVFGYAGATREGPRMSYNFKYTVNELAVDRNFEKMEINETPFLSVIRRPRMYGRIESMVLGNRPGNTEQALESETNKKDGLKAKRERSSKSCPRPVPLDKGLPK